MGPLTNLPPQLLAGWALWLVGGLLLMLWFRRRSTPALRPVVTVRPPVVPASSRQSGVRVPAARPPAPPSPPDDDPFAELHALLDDPK